MGLVLVVCLSAVELQSFEQVSDKKQELADTQIDYFSNPA